MKLFEFDLTEAITDIIFHYVSGYRLVNWLEKNEIILAADFSSGRESELSGKQKYFFLSTTRSRLGGYHRNPARMSALVTLDGRKLNQKYSGKPVDYWGWEFRKTAVDPKASAQEKDSSKGAWEQEDRIFSTEPTIPNAKDYILKIDLLLPTNRKTGEVDFTEYQYDAPVTQHLINLSKNANIPLVLHNNKKSWFTGSDKWHKANVSDIATSAAVDDYKQNRYDDNHVSQYDLRDIDALQELLTKNTEAELSDNGKDLLDKMFRYPDSWVSTLSNIVHNNKNKPAITGPISKVFQKYKVKSFKELLKILYTKWESS